jgi:hypothetical protein
MPNAIELLNAENVTQVVDAVQDIRTTSEELRYLSRLPMTPAEDTEIIAKYTGRIVISDLVADDQAAVVRAANPVTLQATEIPNIKHGRLIGQRGLNALGRLERYYSDRDMNVFADYVNEQIDEVVRGVFLRMEVLVAAMLTDSLTYDRLGIKISGMTWGMPSDLKVTASNLWTDATNATPIADIQNILRVAREKYGIVFNRLSMSTTAFNNMISTAEFRNKAQIYSQITLAANNFPTTDVGLMNFVFGVIFPGVILEIDDRQVWTESSAGAQSSANILPTTKVLFTGTQYDNNKRVMDWANGVVTETKPYTVGTMFGGFTGEREGPVGYTTSADPQGNPPGIVIWGVDRGFPRKHNEAASAVLTVG